MRSPKLLLVGFVAVLATACQPGKSAYLEYRADKKAAEEQWVVVEALLKDANAKYVDDINNNTIPLNIRSLEVYFNTDPIPLIAKYEIALDGIRARNAETKELKKLYLPYAKMKIDIFNFQYNLPGEYSEAKQKATIRRSSEYYGKYIGKSMVAAHKYGVLGES